MSYRAGEACERDDITIRSADQITPCQVGHCPEFLEKEADSRRSEDSHAAQRLVVAEYGALGF